MTQSKMWNGWIIYHSEDLPILQSIAMLSNTHIVDKSQPDMWESNICISDESFKQLGAKVSWGRMIWGIQPNE